MVNTLVQMQVRIFLYFHSILNLKPGLFQNVTSYPFMTRILRDGRAHIHALWFDIYTGEVHCFSRRHKTFVVVNDDTIDGLMEEVDEDGGNVVVEEELLRTARDKMTHSEKCSHGN